MTANLVKTTLDDIARSIDSMQTQMGSMQTQIHSMQAQVGGMQEQMVTKEDFDNTISRLVTKKDFDSSISRLEATIRREAGDLGESIASLANMVAKEFDGLAITRLKTGHKQGT